MLFSIVKYLVKVILVISTCENSFVFFIAKLVHLSYKRDKWIDGFVKNCITLLTNSAFVDPAAILNYCSSLGRKL